MYTAADLDHKDNDCFVCAILSHGEDGFVWGKDKKIPINDLMEPFKGNKCVSLAGKPKIFFIQVSNALSSMMTTWNKLLCMFIHLSSAN